MRMHSKFSEPGSEGELDTSPKLWTKGIVFTSRATSTGIKPGYRISVAFKRGVSPVRPIKGFQELYGRVISIGTRRVAEIAAGRPYLAASASIVCHGWRLLGQRGAATLDADATIAAAFVTLALRSARSESAFNGECEPTDEELQSPGGSSMADVMRAEPQRATEVYNEFDLSDARDSPITVSFGENIAPDEDGGLDFEPSVRRAEEFAQAYHGTLAAFGEVKFPFRIVRREWFLADPRFVTVHLCIS